MAGLKDWFSEGKILQAIGYTVLAFLLLTAILLTAYLIFTFAKSLSSGITADVNQIMANTSQ